MSIQDSVSFESLLARFGLTEFRPGQREVIDALLAGDDCLCIMPTGGGKSLCFQLPSVMRAGSTLVISPLIALMKDQVDSLTERGIRAEFINSTLTSAEQSERIASFIDGRYDLLYVAPERFRSPRFMDAVRQANVQLLAVDEAHCISEWGHDFRHDYSRLGQFRERIGNPQTIALTATATHDVRQDVVAQLCLNQPKTFVAGFARPNLHYEVQTIANQREKRDALYRFVRETAGAGIVYAATRKSCEEIATEMTAAIGRKASVYHGGMEADDRRHVQEWFMREATPVVVATNAFGMGIDKPDVRFVVHFNMPGSLEAYYQEAGRAGRDQQSSRCLLMYSPSDRYIQEFFIESAFPKRNTIAEIYEYLRSREEDPIEVTLEDVRADLDLSISQEGVGTCERMLEKCGVLERLEPSHNRAAVRIDSDVATICDFLPKQAQTQRAVARAIEKRIGDRRFELVYVHPHELAADCGLSGSAVSRALRELSRLDAFTYVPPFRGRALRMIRRDLPFHRLELDFDQLEKRRQSNLDKLQRVEAYATTMQCRQELLLEYFGDETREPCRHCDNCDSQAAASEARHEPIDEPLRVAVIKTLSGVARSHGRFGKNLIAGMLCGSKSAKVQKWKLDQLSTFGILSDLKQTEVQTLIDALIAVGWIEQSEVDRFRPIIKLTSAGDLVMRGERPVARLRLPKMLAARIRLASAVAANDTPARGSRNDDYAEDRSPSPVCRIESSHTEPSPPSGDRRSSAMILSADRPQYYWTWRLLVDGYTVEECAVIRGLDEDQILDHALRAMEEGHVVNLERVFPSSLMSAMRDVVETHPTESVSQWLAKLPNTVRPRHLQLYRRWRAAGNAATARTLDD